jgi:hypothetical protein
MPLRLGQLHSMGNDRRDKRLQFDTNCKTSEMNTRTVTVTGQWALIGRSGTDLLYLKHATAADSCP